MLNSELLDSSALSSSLDEETSLKGPSFKPPLYFQRYEAVEQIIAANSDLRSVLDFGCSDCRLLRHLKQRLPHLQWIVGVDIDGALLRGQCHVIEPLITDYLVRRKSPLYMALLHGCITELDSRVANATIVTLVEVVEHLEKPILQGMIVNVFGNIQPQLVVMTTPNAEFNVLFPDLKGMRHYDHKFEWTRKEFESWCLSICHDYAYDVTFKGIGAGPEGTDVSIGFCSQAAIFKRRASCQVVDIINLPDHNPYELIAEFHHPVDKSTLRDELSLEIMYQLHRVANKLLTEDPDVISEDCSHCQGAACPDDVTSSISDHMATCHFLSNLPMWPRTRGGCLSHPHDACYDNNDNCQRLSSCSNSESIFVTTDWPSPAPVQRSLDIVDTAVTAYNTDGPIRRLVAAVNADQSVSVDQPVNVEQSMKSMSVYDSSQDQICLLPALNHDRFFSSEAEVHDGKQLPVKRDSEPTINQAAKHSSEPIISLALNHDSEPISNPRSGAVVAIGDESSQHYSSATDQEDDECIMIPLQWLIRSRRLHQLCDGSAAALASSLLDLGYKLAADHTVVMYKRPRQQAIESNCYSTSACWGNGIDTPTATYDAQMGACGESVRYGGDCAILGDTEHSCNESCSEVSQVHMMTSGEVWD